MKRLEAIEDWFELQRRKCYGAISEENEQEEVKEVVSEDSEPESSD